MERPLLLPLLSIISGILLAGFFSLFPPVVFLVLLPILVIPTLFIDSSIPFTALICLLFVLWGDLSLKPFLLPELSPSHIALKSFDDPVLIEGVVDSRPVAVEGRTRVYLETESIVLGKTSMPAYGRLLLYIGEGRGDFMTGDRIRFSSRVSRPRNYGLPGEFDYVRFLAFKNIYATAFVPVADDVSVIRERVSYHWQRYIDAIASDMGRFIETFVTPGEGAILRALLLGDAGQIPRSVKDDYSRTGVNHILSISGFHVGIIAVFLFNILLFAAKRSDFLLLNVNIRSVMLLATLPLLIFYLFLTGAAPATVRSVIMIATYIIALALSRETDAINSLILAAVVILSLSPTALYDISFQLSFLALWGILTLTPQFMTPFSKLPSGIIKKLITFFMVSLAATAATVLPAAYYFHRSTLAGLVSNFIVVPLLGYGAVIIGFSALPFIYLSPIVARILFYIAAVLVRITNEAIVVLARIPPLSLINPSLMMLASAYLFLGVLTFLQPGKLRAYSCCALAFLCLGLGLFPSHDGAGELKITFFSVGQGESSLIIFPDGKRMLVDGGGSTREGGSDVGERLLAPALRKMGIDRIDYMVLSHPHPDHLQGLKYVANNFPVGEFWETSSFMEVEDYRELRRIFARRSVPVFQVDSSSPPLMVGGATIEFLSPVAASRHTDPVKISNLNEGSLVFRLSMANFSILFTGDIGEDTEAILLEKPDRLHCTVLKVPHHGSRHSSSSEFIRSVAPHYALISAGYKNTFHLPASQTLDTLRHFGVRIYRTDLDGTVETKCDRNGENITFSTSKKAFPLTNP